MKILIQLFEIIILRRGPQDIDRDASAALIWVILSCAISSIITLNSQESSNAVIHSLTLNFIQIGILYGLLSMENKTSRFIQACTALAGVTTIMYVMIIILSISLPFLILPLVIFNSYLSIYILKQTFDASWLRAIFIAIIINVVAVLCVAFVFPEFREQINQAMIETRAALEANQKTQ